MKKQIFRFRLIAPIIFFFIFLYLTHQLFSFTNLKFKEYGTYFFWTLFVFLTVLSLPLIFWTRPNRGESKVELWIQQIGSYAQGYFSYLLSLVVLRDLVTTTESLFKSPTFEYSLHEAQIIFVFPLFLMFLGRLVVLIGPIKKTVHISIPNLKDDLKNIKIVQISDLHIGPGVTERKIQKLVEKVNALSPDIIALTGDIVDHLDKWFVKEIDQLANLKAKYGSFFIPGNHEYYWGIDQIVHKMQKIKIQVLMNESQKLQIGSSSMTVCGVVDPTAVFFGREGPNYEKAKGQNQNSNFYLLLSHQSKTADQAKDFGFDLQLSGHTHNGQFIPWTWLIKLFQKYPKGLYQIENMQLYVNQGTGFWGPADRLGTYCEVTEIILE